MPELTELLIATNNQGKVKEMVNNLALENLRIYSYKDYAKQNSLNEVPDPEESGSNYLENASIKAIAAYAWAKIPVLADDSGLEVEYLNGEPGIHTARFAGVGASDQENLEKMLEVLQEADNLRARYVSQLIFFDGKNTYDFSAELTGEITLSRSGGGGFGYDPIFIPEGYDKTLADLKEGGVKIATHRIKALSKFKNFLASK